MGAKLPVLLVHGFTSKPGDWSDTLYPRGGALPGAPGTFIVDPFDYEDQNTEWIQENDRSDAARRLAMRIQCLAKQSKDNGGIGRVALVGHSMGGLLIRCALSTSCSRMGEDLAGAAAQVVTIGTPSLGSFLRRAKASGPAAEFGRTVQAMCAAKATSRHKPRQAGAIRQATGWLTEKLCYYVPALGNSSAAQAFVESTTGEPEEKLGTLPTWPDIPVRTLTVDITYQHQILLWTAQSSSVGDLVVSVPSAAYGAAAPPLGGTDPLSCGAMRFTQIGSGPVPSSFPDCWHVTEPQDERVALKVAHAIDAWQLAQDPCVDRRAFGTVAERAGPNLELATMFDGYELRGCSDGYVVGDGFPIGEGEPVLVVLRRESGGWSAAGLYPADVACGETGLPDSVEELMGCVREELRIAGSIAVAADPSMVVVAPDGRHAYVTHGSGSVSVIDTGSGTVESTIPVDGSAMGVTVSPDGRRLYVASWGGPAVSVVDLGTGAVVDEIDVGGVQWDVAASPSGDRVYAARRGAGDLAVIDTGTDTVTSTIQTTDSTYDSPVELALSESGRWAYVTNRGAGTVAVVDTAGGAVVTTVAVGSAPNGIALAPDGGSAYVTNEGSDSVSVIDTGGNVVTRTIHVEDAPVSVAFSPDGDRVYVVNRGSSSLSVVETAGGTVTATLQLGGDLGTAAVTPDGRYVYVTNGGSDVLSVIAVGD
jgi:YVTN family beta-propeller protein